MLDGKKVLEQLLGSGAGGGFAGGLAGGLLGGALASKGGRKLAGSALKVGGLALVGGLAYNAWRNHRQATGAAPSAEPAPPAGTLPTRIAPEFLPPPQDIEGCSRLGLLLARATISAAKADGQVDAEEGRQILARINATPLDPEEKAFLLDQYHAPLDVAGLAAAVDSPEHAAEVYAVSALVVDPPSISERIYLDTLATSLGLDRALAQRIEAEVSASLGVR